mmetsp:Transcript_24328/g.36906  ORF Transcript_24328/g.36906 Transcript_24328/m.36906 type:complete len:102 (-) Transcript_24328:412-717(-)
MEEGALEKSTVLHAQNYHGLASYSSYMHETCAGGPRTHARCMKMIMTEAKTDGTTETVVKAIELWRNSDPDMIVVLLLVVVTVVVVGASVVVVSQLALMMV